jgi:hypothetical protein
MWDTVSSHPFLWSSDYINPRIETEHAWKMSFFWKTWGRHGTYGDQTDTGETSAEHFHSFRQLRPDNLPRTQMATGAILVKPSWTKGRLLQMCYLWGVEPQHMQPWNSCITSSIDYLNIKHVLRPVTQAWPDVHVSLPTPLQHDCNGNAVSMVTIHCCRGTRRRWSVTTASANVKVGQILASSPACSRTPSILKPHISLSSRGIGAYIFAHYDGLSFD